MLQPYRERDRYMLSLLANTPLILTPSRFVRDLYAQHGVPEARLQAVPLGLDLEPWRAAKPTTQPDPGKGLRVGYLGSLLEHKGIHILVRAFRRLQAPGATLEIHGFALSTDPYGGHLQRLTKQDPRAELKGRYQPKDLPDILSRIDVIVIPSLWHETFSIVAREALLSGTPVIASEIGALPEVIDSGQNGVLVPPGDADALYDALQRLSSDPGFLTHLQDGAIRSAKTIKSMEAHVHEIEQLYRMLIADERDSV